MVSTKDAGRQKSPDGEEELACEARIGKWRTESRVTELSQKRGSADLKRAVLQLAIATELPELPKPMSAADCAPVNFRIAKNKATISCQETLANLGGFLCHSALCTIARDGQHL